MIYGNQDKKILGILLTLAMVMGMMPVHAVSAYLWIGGEPVSPAGTSTGTGWSYVSSTNTLTLNGFTCKNGQKSGIGYEGRDELKIILTGTNTITTVSNGIYSDRGVLNISGTGSLSITASNDVAAIISYKDIIIDSGTITAEGGYGIQTQYSGSVIINGGTVTATSTCDNAGIYSTKGITINGGEVTAGGKSYGIFAYGGLTISKGTVKATGSGDNSRGIHAYDSITISGGEVTATGTKADITSESNGITFSGGKVVATATGTTTGACGINSLKNGDPNFVSVSDGASITASGNSGAIFGKVIYSSAAFLDLRSRQRALKTA